MANPTIYRYEVPVDDRWHAHDLHGEILHVAARSIFTVEFWALHQGTAGRRRAFRIYGTGQPLDADCGRYVGTVVHPELVWHLYERSASGGV